MKISWMTKNSESLQVRGESGAIAFAAMQSRLPLSARGLALVLGVVMVAPLAAQDRAAEELARLQGAWAVVAGEQNGKPFDAIRGGTLTVTDRTFALRTAGGNEFKGEIRIKVSTSPAQLDFVHENGMVWEAIYSVDEDAFKLNYVEAGGRDQRPTVFATSTGTAGTIVVMRRMVRQ